MLTMYVVFHFFVAQKVTLFNTRGRVLGQSRSSAIAEKNFKNCDLTIPVVNRIVLVTDTVMHSISFKIVIKVELYVSQSRAKSAF